MICPCRNCPRKGCGSHHDDCATYKEWKHKRLVAKKLNEKEKRT